MVCCHLVCDVESADDLVFLASADSNAMTGQCMHLVRSLISIVEFTLIIRTTPSGSDKRFEYIHARYETEEIDVEKEYVTCAAVRQADETITSQGVH